MYRLENACLSAEFDDRGRLTELACSEYNVIDSPAADSFRLVFRKGGNWENVVFGHEQEFNTDLSGDELRFHAERLRCRDGSSAEIALTLVVKLTEDRLRFWAEIDNRDEDALITDFEYPNVGVIKSLGGGKQALLFPNQSGFPISENTCPVAVPAGSRETVPSARPIPAMHPCSGWRWKTAGTRCSLPAMTRNIM